MNEIIQQDYNLDLNIASSKIQLPIPLEYYFDFII